MTKLLVFIVLTLENVFFVMLKLFKIQQDILKYLAVLLKLSGTEMFNNYLNQKFKAVFL